MSEGEPTARPVRRAVVTITGTGIPTFTQIVTDDQGRFVAASLPAGRFSITAEKPAYIKSYYGSTRPGRPPGMPIALADGQSVDIRIPLARGAAISGRVTDHNGMPVASAQVQVQRVAMVNGERRFVAPQGGVTQATTDDRGAYRVYGLLPGEYVIRSVGGGGIRGGLMLRATTAEEIAAARREASGGSGVLAGGTTQTPTAEGPTVTRLGSFYPGVTDAAAAQSVVIAAGDDRADVNIVSMLVRSVRVEGMAFGPTGEPLSNIAVGIADLSAGSLFTSIGGIRAAPDGRFFVPGLTPGRWLLFGQAAPAGVPSDRPFPWWGQVEVVVTDQDLSGVTLQFLPGSTIAGRFDFRGTQTPPDLTKLRVTLTALPAIAGAGAGVPPASPAADGSFTLDAVPPGKYRVAVSAAGSWSLRSAMASGRDVLDVPLEVAPGDSPSLTLTMIDQPTEISGVLLDQLGRPAPEYSIVVFSADRAMWTVSPRRSSGIVRLGSDGRYRVTGLPPGEYLLAAITDIEPGQLTDISFLEQLARAGIRITLAEGEKKVQDVKIGG